jgi:hypothetical protein
MSNFVKRSFNNNNKAVTATSVKKFCKVCHDAGKTDAEYTSHYVRSSTAADGVVVCPTLLALNCRYCGENGHTVKFCKELEKKKKAEERGVRRAAFEKADKKTVALTAAEKKVTAFAILDSSDSEDEPIDKKPVLMKPTADAKPLFSYAAMASKPASKPVSSAAIVPSIQLPLHNDEEFYEDNDSYQSPPPVYKSNWVPDSYLDNDSDEEEDYVRPIGRPAPWAKDYKQTTTW